MKLIIVALQMSVLLTCAAEKDFGVTQPFYDLKHALESDDGKWKKDFDAFRQRAEQGLDFAGTPGQSVSVEWKAKFLGAKQAKTPKGDDRYEVHLALGPIATPNAKLELEFSCTKAEFQKWQSVAPDSEVKFTADWGHFIMQMPGKPLLTMFFDAKLKELVTNKKTK